jgi:hypothetical protein
MKALRHIIHVNWGSSNRVRKKNFFLMNRFPNLTSILPTFLDIYLT